MSLRRIIHLFNLNFFNVIDDLQLTHIKINNSDNLEEINELSNLYDSQIQALININKQKIIKKYDELT